MADAGPNTATLEQRLRNAARLLDEQSQLRASYGPAYASRDVGPHPSRRRRSLAVGLVSLAAVAALVVAAFGSRGSEPAPSAASDLARNPDLVLLDVPGWTMTRHDERPGGEAESRYGNGTHTVDLHRRPHGYNDEFMPGSDADRPTDSVRIEATEGAGVYVRAFWRTEAWDFELRGDAASFDDFDDLLAGVHAVDEGTWRSVIGSVSVLPEDRAAVVDEMLADMPLPPGFDRAALRQGGTANDRYQLGAAVASAVACGWIEQWVAAKTADDEVSAQQRADALATSHDWAVLREMKASGAYPDVLWEYADAINGGPPVPSEKGDGNGVASSYVSALGCDINGG
jgi:hypothetical protein